MPYNSPFKPTNAGNIKVTRSCFNTKILVNEVSNYFKQVALNKGLEKRYGAKKISGSSNFRKRRNQAFKHTAIVSEDSDDLE